MKAHERLVEAFVQWRLKQQACEAMPLDPLQAAYADEAWATLKVHAVNCGWSEASGPLSAWAPRRVRSYGKSIGVSELEIGVVLGEALPTDARAA
jgi:hypothetical protein